MKVLRYPINAPGEETVLLLPIGHITYFGEDPKSKSGFSIWFLCSGNEIFSNKTRLVIAATGQNIPDGEGWICHSTIRQGIYMWHLFTQTIFVG